MIGPQTTLLLGFCPCNRKKENHFTGFARNPSPQTQPTGSVMPSVGLVLFSEVRERPLPEERDGQRRVDSATSIP